MIAGEVVDGFGLPQVGLGLGWGVAFLFVVALLRGRLIPRDTHNDVIHDRDEWRAESRIKDAQLTEKDQQLRELSEVGRAVNAVMRAIQRGPKDGVP